MTVWFAPHYHCLPLNTFADKLPCIVPHPSSCFKWYIHSSTFILNLHGLDKTAKETAVWSIIFTSLLFIYLLNEKINLAPWTSRLLHSSAFDAGVVSRLADINAACSPVLSCPVLSVQNNLQDRNDPPQLLVDTKQTFPVVFPYAPSALSLETLHIPASLGLDFLVRVWGLDGHSKGQQEPDHANARKTVRADGTRAFPRQRPPPPEVLHGTYLSIEF